MTTAFQFNPFTGNFDLVTTGLPGPAITGFTPGSVIFAGTPGLAEDNANFFYDATNHRLGIGTDTPSVALDVVGNEHITGQQTIFSSGVSGLILVADAFPTDAIITHYGNANTDVFVGAEGDIGNHIITGSSDYAAIFVNNGNFPLQLGTNNIIGLTMDISQQVGIGTVSPTALLDVNGSARIRALGAGVVHSDASGNLSSSPVSLTVDVSGVLPIANGGTNSSTALANGLMIVSSGGKLVEVAADSSMASNKITSVKDPTAAQDAATKNYVDSAVAALQPLTSVFAASVANISGTYLNGVAGVGATFTTTSTATFTIDGTTPALLSRILIKNQSSGFQNGVYQFTTAPVGGVSGAIFTRTLDYDTAADMNAAGLIPVINGTVNALSSWQQVAVITTVGTDALVFTEFTANPSLYLLKANNLNDVANSATSFNNISPMTTGGDIIYGGASGAGTRLANGSSGQVLTSNGGTSAPSWQSTSASVAIRTITTTASLANGDGVVYADMSGGGYTLTIPAAAVGNQNRIYYIKKISADYNILTLSGGLSTTLNTQGESIQIINDGSTWSIIDRIINASIGSYIPTVTGFTSNPSFGTVTLNAASVTRIANTLAIQWSFVQSTAGTGGSGRYIIGLPPGLTLDPTDVNTNFPSTSESGCVGSGGAGGAGSFISLMIVVDTSGNICMLDPIATNAVGSGYISLANTSVSYTASFTVPITGWNSN